MSGSIQASTQKIGVVSEPVPDETQREESVESLARGVFQRISNGHWRSISEFQKETQSSVTGVLAKLNLSPRGDTHFVCLEQLRALSPNPPTSHLDLSPPPNCYREDDELSSLTDLSETPKARRSGNTTPTRDSRQNEGASFATHSELEESEVPFDPPTVSRTASWASLENGEPSDHEREPQSVSVTPTQILFENGVIDNEPEESEPSFEPQSSSLTCASFLNTEASVAAHSESEEEGGKEVDLFVLENMHSVSVAQLNGSYAGYVPDDYTMLSIEQDTYSENDMESFPLKAEQFFEFDSWVTLKLGRCAIKDFLLEEICKLNKKLIRVTLFNCLEIENPSFLRNCVELRELCLSWCRNLSPQWLAKIPEGTWPHLEILELANTPTTSEMLMDLPPLPLRRLDLSHCWWIDDPKAFVDLIKHPRLYWIRIEGAKVSEQAIEQLRTLRPGIQIIGMPIDHSIISSSKAVEEGKQAHEEIEPFILKRYMAEAYRLYTWNCFDNLIPYKNEIEGFYLIELQMRGLKLQVRLDTPEGWLEAEKTIQQHDRPNLSLMMDVLVPMLPKEGYFKNGVNGKRDCFRDLWEINCNLRLLNQICELNFSKKGLTEIPPSFWWLYFCRVGSLNFSENKIKKLPKEIVELISAEDQIDQKTTCQVLVKRAYHFLSRYPQLKVLNFSNNQIGSLNEVFPNGMLVTNELEVIDFSRNEIRDLPSIFGISPARIAPGIVIDLSRNLISHVKTLDDLGSSDPVKITLDLRDNEEYLEFNVPKEIPDNVDVKRGNTVEPSQKKSDATEEKKEE